VTIAVGRGKCSTVAVTTTLQALNQTHKNHYTTPYTNPNRLLISYEEGNKIRMTNIKGTDNRANEITIATVKKLPFPIHDREFVGKLIWTKSTPDTYSVVWDTEFFS
jgi:hypothetical protein